MRDVQPLQVAARLARMSLRACRTILSPELRASPPIITATSRSGHAEAIRITFDPDQLSFDDLLDIFFATHDPTQLNRQGNDVGTQYRSAIFPHSPEQEEEARKAIVRNQTNWQAPIVTTIEKLAEWYPAEAHHQDYWEGEGQRSPYCLAVIPPKLQKLRKGFADRLRNEAV